MLRRMADTGMRMTGQRETVVRTIDAKHGTFTAEALVDELRPVGIGRATVYRALDVLEKLGMLTRMHQEGCHGYTVCDEGHHHHLVCGTCNKVVEIDATGVEAEIRELATKLKFRVDTHTLEFAGRCEDCQTKAA